MNQEKIINDLLSLPPEAQQQVVNFILFMKKQYNKPRSNKKLDGEGFKRGEFIGMWKDRMEMQDSTAWVRLERKREWME